MRKKPLPRLVMPLLALALLLTTGTVGYALLGRGDWLDSLYMTVITLTTVGYREVVHPSRAAKMFTILLLALGIVIGGWAIRSLVDIVVSEQIRGDRRRRRMQRAINQLQDHFIICGCGRIGQEIIRQMEAARAPFVVIDKDHEKVDDLQARGCLCITGDATRDEMLLQAGVERAKGLTAVVDSDAENIFIILTARELNPRLYIAARSNAKEDEAKLQRAGADRVISPYVIGGRRIAAAMMRPTVVDFLDLVTHGREVELELDELQIMPGCEFCHVTLRDAGIRERFGVTILGRLTQGGELEAHPKADMVIVPNDTLIVIGTPAQLQKVREAM